MRGQAPYGSWESPITSDVIVTDAVRIGQICLDDQVTYWTELRPSDGGRTAIVAAGQNDELTEVVPPEFNVRTRSHEYGGGAFAVSRGLCVFSNDADQGIYVRRPGELPGPLLLREKSRFADYIFDHSRNRVLCIQENHSRAGLEPENRLVAVDFASGEMQTLAEGADFYSSPCLQPGGQRLAWLSWNHPNMPWDGCELWLGEFDQRGLIASARKVAGGKSESIFQPQWSPDGTLYFVSDRSGWWNLYRFAGDKTHCLWRKEAEFGLPQWVFGMSTYAFVSKELLACTFFEDSAGRLALLHLATGVPEIIDLPFTHIDQVRADSESVVFCAGSPILALAVVRFDLRSREFRILRRSARLPCESTYISRPEAIAFPTTGGQQAHAYFYSPQNLQFSGPENTKPPLIVKTHGGPTGATATTLDLRIQFWTSRGFAVLDVNYGGSTGYGRAYRERLNGAWGVVDVDDCVNAARFVCTNGLADENRVAIAGGSAGGFTVLCALTFRDFFKAGASYYGICDLEALALDTHKFERHYLDGLIGPYPERQDIYRQRSPIHATGKLSCPVIIMQGTEDKIVPPSQAAMMMEAVRKKGLPVAFLLFEGEQHGFRKAETIKRSLEAELYFYSKIFDFQAADRIEPIAIANLPEDD